MNFKTLLSKLFEARSDSEAFTTTGEAVAKDKAKGAAPDIKSKDAARKRAERAREIPRDKKPKTELVREVIAVRTKSGRIQLIFKDSFNKETHTKISEQELTLPEAKQIAGDPKFEQTRASVLLLGDVKTKEPTEKKEKKPEEEKKEKTKEGKPEEEKKEKPKAKKLSPQEMMQAMTQMPPEQLAGMPFETREEYFQAIRNPPNVSDFDRYSYEELSVKYGINPSSDLPYNQQVLNALVFLAKTKVGASDQEMSTYAIMAPAAMEFGRGAFAQAKKILSQIGDQCINSLVANIEQGVKSVNNEGTSDMQCGNYKFKVYAGGEMSISTTSYDQGNKNFKGFLAASLTKALQQQIIKPTDEKVAKIFNEIEETTKDYNETLISQESLQQILQNPKYIAELQKTPVFDREGNQQGTVLDENGNLNPLSSLEAYQDKVGSFKEDILKTFKTNKQNDFSKLISDNLLKMVVRGDGIVPPETAPTHVITVNGIFPMSDEYFNQVASTASLEGKPAKDTTTVSNISKYKPSSAEKMSKFKAIIEAKEPSNKAPSLKELMISRNEIDVSSLLANAVANSFDFDFNASLLPGFSPKDLNTVEFTYVTINGKTTKIPVMQHEKLATKLIGEGYFVINDILIEALTNNFVLSNLLKANLITELESDVLYNGVVSLLESSEAANVNLQTIYNNINQRIDAEPQKLYNLFDLINEEYKRDYKMEYRNYHGKAKQKKQRAARTRARELMKKKGLAKKGDGKDIDHKKPLRSGGSNGINNLRKRNKSENRSDNGHRKGEKQNKDWK